MTPTTGAQKAALVLLSMDQGLAAEVLRHMSECDVRRLAECADSLNPEIAHTLNAALEEFERNLAQPILAHDAGAYMRQLAASSFGDDRAQRIFAPNNGTAQPIDTIRSARTATLAELLSDESPQVAAVILSQLPRGQAAKVLSAIEPERQTDLLARIAALETLPAEMVDLASQALAEALSGEGGMGSGGEDRKFDGLSFAAGVLNELKPADSERLLGALQTNHETLAPKVREAMFVFEDLRRLDVRGLQLLMREVQVDRLLIALKTASEELREQFLASVSSRAAASMREDLSMLPPTRLSDVEAAQRDIVEAATRLASAGRLVLPTNGGEELV